MRQWKALGVKAGVAGIALSGAVGCASIFGYEYSQGSECDPGCSTEQGCPPENLCVANSVDASIIDVVVATSDAAAPRDGASESETDSTPADGSGDGDAEEATSCDVGGVATTCGPCASACTSGVCTNDGACLYPVNEYPQGYDSPMPSAQGPTFTVSPGPDAGAHGEIAGELVHLPRGVLAGLGVISDYQGDMGYLALYTSVNGQPATRIAATAEFTTLGGGPDQADPLQTAVAVAPMFVDEADYWVLSVWQSTVFLAAAFPVNECDSGMCLPFYGLYTTFGPLPAVATPKPNIDSLGAAPPFALFATMALPAR